jgi:hypothetical protein
MRHVFVAAILKFLKKIKILKNNMESSNCSMQKKQKTKNENPEGTSSTKSEIAKLPIQKLEKRIKKKNLSKFDIRRVRVWRKQLRNRVNIFNIKNS